MNKEVNIVEDEITLKELILKFKEYFFEILRNWWLVLLICTPFIGYFLYKHYSFKPLYSANVRYIVEGSSNNSGIAGLLGQFGIRRDSKVNPYKIQEVARSRNILKKVLFTKLDGEFLANKIIVAYDFDKIWSEGEDKSLVGFRFKDGELAKTDTIENSIFMGLIGKMIGSEENRDDAIMAIDYNEENGVFTHGFSSPSQDLSLALMEAHYEVVKQFFEEEVVFAQASTVKILKAKADSLQNLINTKVYASATIQDRSLGLVNAAPAVRGERLQREALALSTALTEVIKSYEIADVNLKDIKPSFLQIEASLPPLKPSHSSMLISLIKALLFGGIVAVIFIIGRSVVREALV